MSKPTDREIVNAKKELIANAYVKHREVESLEDLLYKLIEDGLTTPKRLQNWLIIKRYREELSRQPNAYLIQMLLAEEFDVSPRYVQNVYYKWTEKFKSLQ